MKRVPIRLGPILLENAGPLAIFITLTSWQFLTGSPLNTRTALTIAGLYLTLTLLDTVRKIRDYSSALESASPSAEEKKRTFVEDPEVVLSLAQLRGYDAIERFTPYLGKWMTISGEYEGMAESLRRDSIHLSLLLNDGRRINLRFGMDREPELRRLRAGQRITAICQIQHRDSTFTPENCELVRSEPLCVAPRSRLIA